MSQRHTITDETSSAGFPPSAINWRQLCHVMLQKALPLNPLSTQPDDPGADLQESQITLGAIATPAILVAVGQVQLSISQTYEQEAFCEQVLRQGKSPSQGQRIAIIGESGTGKTLMLQKIAHWILQQTSGVPIWLSPGQLKGMSLSAYLWEKWLPQAASQGSKDDRDSKDWATAFRQLCASGQIWLLLDGIDYLINDIPDESTVPSLSYLFEQLQGAEGQFRTVLTCQTRTWQQQQQALLSFDLFCPVEFSYPQAVNDFILNWFRPAAPFGDRQIPGNNLGEQLCRLIAQSGRERFRSVLANPLRLALLCRLWQQSPGHLGETLAELYEQLTVAFYQWKAEMLATSLQQQQQLTQRLGKLAFNALSAETVFPSIEPEAIAETEAEDPLLLRLAVQLGWLMPVGVAKETTDKGRRYVFTDPSFGEYFAARSVDRTEHFLDADGAASPSETSHRIFEALWWRVALFWLGRPDVPSRQKEAFLAALISLEDGCGPDNFYGKKAYFLAATGLTEFKDCSVGEKICRQLIAWGFQSPRWDSCLARSARESLAQVPRPMAIASLLEWILATDDPSRQRQAFLYLEHIAQGDPIAIAAFAQQLAIASSAAWRQQIAQSLGTIEPGNDQAISVFVDALETAVSTGDDCQAALNGLTKIAQGSLKAIAALIRLLSGQSSSTLRRRVLPCLEMIAQGNATAIAVLVQLIRTTEDVSLRQQAAASLEKIDPGNPTAIAVLVQLLHKTDSAEIARQAVYSLGEVSVGNAQAIAELVNLLQETDDSYTRWIAISSLGKIGAGNSEAITALTQLIESDSPLLLHKEAIDSLSKIAVAHPSAIAALVALLQTTDDEAVRREAAESLGKLDPGNPAAIAVLSDLLQSSQDEFTRRQAAASLGKIDSGNLEALKALVQLIQSSREKDIRSLAAESLGEIGLSNPAAIATLIRLLQTNPDADACRSAAKSLGKIAKGNKEAIATFISLLKSLPDEASRMALTESLLVIVPAKQLGTLVVQLRDTYLDPHYRGDAALQSMFWHCAEHLSYSAFYQAWHQRSFPKPSVCAPTSQQIERAIASLSTSQVQVIGIDSSRFLDPHAPAVDIYDQMLEQACPPFEHGIPETLSKLRLYWHQIQRDRPDVRWVLLFYHCQSSEKSTDFSAKFLEILPKFQGKIGIVTSSSVTGVKQFSPDDPQLADAIAQWL